MSKHFDYEALREGLLNLVDGDNIAGSLVDIIIGGNDFLVEKINALENRVRELEAGEEVFVTADELDDILEDLVTVDTLEDTISDFLTQDDLDGAIEDAFDGIYGSITVLTERINEVKEYTDDMINAMVDDISDFNERLLKLERS